MYAGAVIGSVAGPGGVIVGAFIGRAIGSQFGGAVGWVGGLNLARIIVARSTR
jgi:hypothetical protein